MGWTFQHRPKGISHRDFFSKNYFGDGFKIMDSSSPEFGVLYMAVKNLVTEYVFGAVFLLQWNPHDEYNFGYKDMSEDMGPFSYECPERLLNLMSNPPSNAYAVKWRANCRANIARRNLLNEELKVGADVEFERPIRFGSGDEVQEFDRLKVLLPSSKSVLFTASNVPEEYRYSCRRYRLSRRHIIKSFKTINGRQAAKYSTD